MSTLVGSEFLKLRTTRGWIGYVLALVILSGIGAAAQVGSALEFERDSPEFRLDLLSSSVAAGLIAFLVGITSVTVRACRCPSSIAILWARNGAAPPPCAAITRMFG